MPAVSRNITPSTVSSRMKLSISVFSVRGSSRSTASDTRSETWRATSPARSVSSPSTRLRASAEAESSSAACCERFSYTMTEPTASDTAMAAATATAMYLLLKLTMLT